MLLLRLQVAARQHSVHQSDMFADNALLVAEAHRLGADLEGCDQNGFTPLLWAAHQVTPFVLVTLLPTAGAAATAGLLKLLPQTRVWPQLHGWQIESALLKSRWPLELHATTWPRQHHAVQGRLAVVQLLLELGARIDVTASLQEYYVATPLVSRRDISIAGAAPNSISCAAAQRAPCLTYCSCSGMHVARAAALRLWANCPAANNDGQLSWWYVDKLLTQFNTHHPSLAHHPQGRTSTPNRLAPRTPDGGCSRVHSSGNKRYSNRGHIASQGYCMPQTSSPTVVDEGAA